MHRLDGRSIWRAWKLANEAEVGVFNPEVTERLPLIPGWSALRLPRDGLLSQPRVSVVDALRAVTLATDAERSNQERADLVATIPERIGGVGGTRDAIRTLVASAQSELLIVGFAISDEEIRDLLVRRGMAGVHVTVVGDRADGGARDLRVHWPARAFPLTALEDVEPLQGESRRMHAKVVVADGQSGLIGSANFTFSGMDRNIELGVLVEASVCQKVLRMVDELQRAGWLAAA